MSEDLTTSNCNSTAHKGNNVSSDSQYYDERWQAENLQQQPPNGQRFDRVVSAVQFSGRLCDNASILDVGCGNGWLLERFTQCGCKSLSLRGLEPSPAGAKNARKRVPSASVHLGCLTSDFTTEKFDVITCSEVVEHVEQQPEFLQLMYNFLAPGGVLVLTTPNGRYRSRYFELHNIEPQPVENWLTVANLNKLASEIYDSHHLSTFDLSHWYELHPKTRGITNQLIKLRGGWRTHESWKSLAENFFQLGLYQILTGYRK
ncbi:class I SAM-dependent methyltransferase [Calycomorphotria hydatis]|uniref:Putative S-adenosylmethionine-dependent methyltransferase/MSMEI_2290 n=1 Tax=Calycomorphotria hydatis TaxID=2528027 RepID=A0A517T4K0_9PLAN|nr:class I SAM-dependent methyltransferase [Calycomorphotria hydatis]QDT63295.1 putative S-adenosylmethionine-dependent methyltransferase/MSMEI_2290 [Calycomorphotria hydatis]